ncbi:serine/threonine-protein kinase [Dactylosporangium sp. AC04546]|uniref:serine/threonine-protein kinase n=1 Tax=Dactylosporangium sp. AC04546 TaxID=2862460 RepID=UPI001EDF0AD5|nr:serine/threonine-protein kinase [Dactylosporangium sp. AC04546]WVK82713.1 serine/threonine-protein kinase [Dactylosporangium sp. AC04546]
MGEVWAGYDDKLDRPVAIKFLRQPEAAGRERATAIERFKREARATARLDHPGVPAVHDVGFHDGDIYIVMQLVSGLVLADLIAERDRLSVPWAAAIGAQICSVLAAAHAASLVHRDLKPQNVMITPAGTVKVLDFGVTALLGADLPRLTISGQPLGTPAYIAPEQAQSTAVGPRTDLYALGCVLYELLTGSPPYAADSAAEMLHRHLTDPIPLVADYRGGVPGGVVELVTRLLAKDPADRPESAAQVYELLVPFATAASGLAEDPAVILPSGQSVDPTMPYRYPFGPLPRPTPPVPAMMEVLGKPRVYEPLPIEELEDVQDRVRALAEAERFTQAAELLATALQVAAKEPDANEARLLDLRLDLANLHMLAGAYREALSEFVQLAADLAGWASADRELVWHCRQQAAVCHAELGDVPAALLALRALLTDEQRVLSADAPQIVGLRHQIAMLTAGIGDLQGTRNELEA